MFFSAFMLCALTVARIFLRSTFSSQIRTQRTWTTLIAVSCHNLHIKIDLRMCTTQTKVINLALLPEQHTPQEGSHTLQGGRGTATHSKEGRYSARPLHRLVRGDTAPPTKRRRQHRVSRLFWAGCAFSLTSSFLWVLLLSPFFWE